MVHKTRTQLSTLNPHDDHTVLLLDGPYSWFQLRPEVLLSRYHSILEKANERLVKGFDRRAVTEGGMKQSVVFSGQRCRSGPSDQVSCVRSSVSKRSDTNPHSLDIGSIIGPAKDLRAIFDRAAAKLEHSTNAVDAQSVFDDIFNQQQIRREAIRQQSWSVPKRTWSSLAEMVGLGGTVLDSNIDSNIDVDETYEFGISVDAANELGLSVNGNVDNIEWIQHSSASGLRDSPSSLPTDIAESMPPFWTTSGYGVPLETRWEDVNLLADTDTEAIPAIISFSAGNVSTLQTTGWNKLWMHSHAQKLYEAQIPVPRLPLASIVDGGGVEHIFWNPDTRLERDGAKTFAGEWVAWQDICRGESTWRALGKL
ncbi:hypothetical protein LTR65_008674 [Meristemomyces frigidus]